MKKLFLLLACSAGMLLMSCGEDDENPGMNTSPCLPDQSLGLVDLESATLNLISDELQDSSIAIYVDEYGDQMIFNISDGNGAQNYLQRIEEKSPDFDCEDGSFSASYTPEEFFLKLISEDETFEIEWRARINSNYNVDDGQIEFSDVLTITGVNRVMGEMVFINKHGPIGPEQQGGGQFPEVFIHGEKIENAFLDDIEFENSNLVVNEDFGIAAFKDRFGNWWRNIDFK